MSNMTNDPMWSVFKPLWQDLQNVRESSLLICGGYGLFLKQKWLSENTSELIVVPLAQWRDAQPRGTKYFDIVIGLDLIAEAALQRLCLDVLEKHGFVVTEENPRWQFRKQMPGNRSVLLELHAPVPLDNQAGFQVDRIRVKRKPSLGENGVHGRANSEAIGCTLMPFHFEVEGVACMVTNPVTWCVMKLTAMYDQHGRSIEEARTREDRAFCRSQAAKHAKDVCRIAAMVTRNEMDASASLINSIRSRPQFSKAAEIHADFFLPDDGWGVMATDGDWDPEDMRLIRATLARWFSETARLSPEG